MMLTSKLEEIKKTCEGVRIVAATKYVGVKEMLELRESGIKDFGENRVQAFLEKYEELKPYEDLTWHFIGNLQTNKVSSMINKISYLHSLNSLKLARYINRYRLKPLKCFIEVNLTNSETKQGILESQVLEFLAEIKPLKNVSVIGLMTMTEKFDSREVKLETFQKLAALKKKLNALGYENITELSMGMSDDYELAIKAQTTFVRLGRILFEGVI